ncbi:hypothetical protein WDU94_012889, partial [Cyamophila willieti]
CVCDRYFLGDVKCYRRDSFSPILLSSVPRSSLLSKFENAIFELFFVKASCIIGHIGDKSDPLIPFCERSEPVIYSYGHASINDGHASTNYGHASVAPRGEAASLYYKIVRSSFIPHDYSFSSQC